MRRHRLAVCLLILGTPLLAGVRRTGVAKLQRAVPPIALQLEVETSYRWRPALAAAGLQIEPLYDAKRLAIARLPAATSKPPYLGVSWRRVEPAARNAVALTFDTEIPHGIEAQQTLRRVLDTLAANQVHATFFVVGNWARANPGLLRHIAADGHEIASHSLTHVPFAGRTPAELRADLEGVERLVQHETGESVARLFRPPYGCIDDDDARIVLRRGYRLVGWDISGRDASNETVSPEEVINAVRRDLHAGGTILLHTNRWITAAALPGILRLLAARGLRPVTVSELLRRQPVAAAVLSRAARHPCHAEPVHFTAIAQLRGAP